MPNQKYFKVIACEIAARELYHVAAGCKNLIDFEFLTQGYHDTPNIGKSEIQKRIEATPSGKYDAILLGYGLCSTILSGVKSQNTPVVVPRAHDCITLFVGSKERYQELFTANPGTYYFTSGWLEYARRRGDMGWSWGGGASVPANANLNFMGAYETWVEKYGEEQAKYLLEETTRWTNHYAHGVLIQFDFLRGLGLEQQVRNICAEKNWEYGEVPGDLRLLRNLLAGEWDEKDFLVLEPGKKVAASFDEKVVGAA